MAYQGAGRGRLVAPFALTPSSRDHGEAIEPVAGQGSFPAGFLTATIIILGGGRRHKSESTD